VIIPTLKIASLTGVPRSVNQALLSKTDHTTHCGWKGDAKYYSINLDKTELKNAAWYYPEPLEKAKNIKDYVAFCELSQCSGGSSTPPS